MSVLQWQPALPPESLKRFIDSSPLFSRFVNAARSFAAVALRIWLRTFHHLEIVGRENLPADGSCVLIANHTSHLDALCLLSALPLAKLNRTFPAAAEDYFFASPPRVAFSLLINAIPFARDARVRRSLERCRDLLAHSGNILILFPEGTRSTTGRLGHFRPGVGRLVAGSDVPVVPCALQGGFLAWPKGAILPRPRRLRLIIGKPRHYEDLPPVRQSADAVADDLQHAVEELLCT